MRGSNSVVNSIGLDLFNKALDGDVDAMIKIWEIISEEDEDDIGGGNYG